MKAERLAAKDWERYRAIRLRALADAPDAFARTHAEEVKLKPEEWRARLSDQAATFAAVIEAADVGLVTGAELRGHDGIAGLFGLWVAPEARRRGVGEVLVSAVINWARTSAFTRVVIEVADNNKPAIELYARTGFAPTGATGNMPPPREHISEHERALELKP